MPNEIFQKVIQHWKKDGVKVLPPASEKTIVDCFKKIEKPISEDILEFYSLTAGMSEDEIDSEAIAFWSLEQLVKENLITKSELALFSDFLIFSHCWGFKFESDKRSSVHIDYFSKINRYEQVANSLEEFFEKYLEHPDNIFVKVIK